MDQTGNGKTKMEEKDMSEPLFRSERARNRRPQHNLCGYSGTVELKQTIGRDLTVNTI